MAAYISGGGLSQRTADRLYSLIVDEGEFPPGAKLPNENQLAERFGISRATLREAIKTLAARGILRVNRGTGTFVADALPEKSGLDLAEITRMRVELRDLYEVRLIFEPQVAELACKRATDGEIAEIRRLCTELQRLSDEGGDTTEADLAFHTAIMTAAHNDFVAQLLPLVNMALSDRRFLEAEEKLTTCVQPDHELITELMEKRDAESVRSALYIHLRRIINSID